MYSDEEREGRSYVGGGGSGLKERLGGSAESLRTCRGCGWEGGRGATLVGDMAL